MAKPNVLITFDSHTPYLAFRVKALQEEIEKRNLADKIRLRVLLLSTKDPNYNWKDGEIEAEYGGVPVTILPHQFHGLGFRSYASGLALKTVWETFCDILSNKPKIAFLGGYDRPSSLLIGLLGRLLFFKTGPMHDSRFNDAESFSKSFFMEAAKVPFMRIYHFFMCSGQECVDYTRFLAGKKRPAQFAGWNVLDNEDIAKRADNEANDQSIRDTFGLKEDEAFFFMPVRYIAKKNIPRVIEAYANASAKATSFPKLIMAGKGELREDVEALITEKKLSDRIALIDWLPYEQIPRAAKLSEAVLLASTHDQWGLTINEALAAGAPVIVSNRAGSHEIVQNSVNGFTFTPQNTEHLTHLLHQMGTEPELVTRLRKETRKSMESFSRTQFLAAWFEIFQRYQLIPEAEEKGLGQQVP